MKLLTKIGAVLLVSILLISYIYVVSFMKSEESADGDNNDRTSVYLLVNDNDDKYDVAHTVFIEEGTATWCENCPNIAAILDDLYNTREYNFYYVSMVDDGNEKAHNRLYLDYNILGFPTVFIDGGYNVIVGGIKTKSEFSNAIRTAEKRKTPNIRVTIKAEYDNTTSEINTEVLVENNENETYTGVLKVYLTEIISRWINHHSTDPRAYHYGFIDYVINEDISVNAKGNITVSVTKKLSDFPFSDLDQENLMVIATVFNSKSTKEYAYPPNENPFDAYFADATNATKVTEGGTLPPEVAICSPDPGKLHILGYPIMKTLKGNTILIGKSKIALCIQNEPGVKKVEFYIDGQLKYTDTEKPYEWSFSKIGPAKQIIGKHTLMIRGFDYKGKTATDSMDVVTFIL